MRVEVFNNRKDWLKWRHEGIGGSDVAKLFNSSRYGDRLDLYLEKTAKEPRELDLWGTIQIQAQVAEDDARKLLEEHLKCPMPATNLEDMTKPELRLSLDGYNILHGELLEHKLMGKVRREQVEAWLKGNEHFMAALEDKAAPQPMTEIAYQLAYQAHLTQPKFIYLIITDYQTQALKVYRNKVRGCKKWAKHGKKVEKKVLEFWKVVNAGRGTVSGN